MEFVLFLLCGPNRDGGNVEVGGCRTREGLDRNFLFKFYDRRMEEIAMS
jgi:hypothetical protein